MATMARVFLVLSDIDRSKIVPLKNGKKGYPITISINDEVDKYQCNVKAWTEQTKEEKDAKTQRNYLGNGTCFWSNGKVTVVTKDKPQGAVVGAEISDPVVAKPTPPEEVAVEEDGDLPF